MVKEIDITKKPTREQIKMLEKASRMPITYDEDSPELKDAELARFVRISDFKMKKDQTQTISLQSVNSYSHPFQSVIISK